LSLAAETMKLPDSLPTGLIFSAMRPRVRHGRDGLVDQGLLGEQGLEFRTENVDQREREVAVAFLERWQCDQLALAR
jgi:hypothetical protein